MNLNELLRPVWRDLDLIVIAGVALAGLYIGNAVETFGVFSAGHPNLGAGAALFFLSHNDISHAAENLQAAAGYGFGVGMLRVYAGLTGDRPFLLAAIGVSHVLTLCLFIWALPYSETGAHGLSVVTSAMLGFFLVVLALSVARRFSPGRARAAGTAAAACLAAIFLAWSWRAHGYEADLLLGDMRGELGHGIGFLSGLIASGVYAVRGGDRDICAPLSAQVGR